MWSTIDLSFFEEEMHAVGLAHWSLTVAEPLANPNVRQHRWVTGTHQASLSCPYDFKSLSWDRTINEIQLELYGWWSKTLIKMASPVSSDSFTYTDNSTSETCFKTCLTISGMLFHFKLLQVPFKTTRVKTSHRQMLTWELFKRNSEYPK